MEVLETNSAWLSDYEVLEHLKEQKALRDKVATALGRPVKSAENVLTVEFETLGYFQDHPSASRFTEETMAFLMDYLKGFALTKAEKLQIVNLLPRTDVEFYLIVEECDERFTQEQIGEILGQIKSIPSPN